MAPPTTRSARILVASLGGALAVAVVVFATVVARDAGDSGSRGPNVILIVIDTLRADHLGCYGYPVATSPEVDRFAEEAVLFETAIAHAPSTLPWTSMYVRVAPLTMISAISSRASNGPPWPG